MENEVNPIPFGLQFEEPASPVQGLMQVLYDEETDVSYVEDSLGRRIPCVEYVGTVGTETLTKAGGEPTDEDEDRLGWFIGTNTFTEVEAEETDTDPQDDNSRAAAATISTQTITAVQAESTDTDAGED